MDTVQDFQTNPEFDDMVSDGMMYLREKHKTREACRL
jgi:hypothetical protein